MLLGTFCVARDDRRAAQSFTMGNSRGMSFACRDVPGLSKGRMNSPQRAPRLQSLLGPAETPEKHQILFTPMVWQEKGGFVGRMGID